MVCSCCATVNIYANDDLIDLIYSSCELTWVYTISLIITSYSASLIGIQTSNVTWSKNYFLNSTVLLRRHWGQMAARVQFQHS